MHYNLCNVSLSQQQRAENFETASKLGKTLPEWHYKILLSVYYCRTEQPHELLLNGMLMPSALLFRETVAPQMSSLSRNNGISDTATYDKTMEVVLTFASHEYL